ncbi:hypothetical protein [Streptomyces wuyuanensis]|uniref:hypothetical protein n=1 Tax=Streptomyces wuyuanensis TaxID=1196353 RepID=UPI00342B3FE7
MTAPKKTAAVRTPAPKKVEAAKVEAIETVTEETPKITFEHRGITFEIPHPLDFPIGVFETDDEFEAARLIVGEEQWAAYKATGATLRDFSVFADKMSEAQGMDESTGN